MGLALTGVGGVAVGFAVGDGAGVWVAILAVDLLPSDPVRYEVGEVVREQAAAADDDGGDGGEHVASAARMRSLIRQSGSRTLHFAYWPQFSSSVEQAAWPLTSSTRIQR